MKTLLQFGACIVVAIVIAGVVRAVTHHGSGDRSSQVANEAGASLCDNSGYYVESQLSGKRQTIYDCTLNGKLRCVTENGGLASDSTEEVRLVFSSTLGASKPFCLSG